jgi:hypothetical protein
MFRDSWPWGLASRCRDSMTRHSRLSGEITSVDSIERDRVLRLECAGDSDCQLAGQRGHFQFSKFLRCVTLVVCEFS